MNITIDDTSSYLSYSSQWKVQPPGDPLAPQYFSGTYHDTQEDGANVTLTFNGMAIYIYGSTGPGHGNFSVRWSNRIETLSALSPTFKTQQLLFSRVFPTDGSEGGGSDGSGGHEVLLTSIANGNSNWLDIDYMSLTVAGNASQPNPGFYTTTNADLLSAIATETFAAGAQSSGGSPASSSSSSSHQSNLPTLITTIVLGVLLITTLVVFLVTVLLGRRRRRRRRKSEVQTKTASMYFPYQPTAPAPMRDTMRDTTRDTTIDISPPPHVRAFSPQSHSTNTSQVVAIGGHDGESDRNPLVIMRSSQALHMREAHNQSAMGWSIGTAGDTLSPEQRVGSPSNSAKPPPSPASQQTEQTWSSSHRRSNSRAWSAKPPSYSAPYNRAHNEQYWPSQHFEQISEADTNDMSQPTSPNQRLTPTSTDPLRINTPNPPVRRSSTHKPPLQSPTTPAPASRPLPTPVPQTRIPAPPRVKPTRPERPPRSTDNLYDEGDSTRTNFLQV